MSRRLDWPLLAAVSALLALGSLLVWSSTAHQNEGFGPGGSESMLWRHLVGIVVGALLATSCVAAGQRRLQLLAPIAYVAAVLGLGIVLLAGDVVNGARAWLALPGGFSLQPGEFAKVSLVLLMGFLLAERGRSAHAPNLGDVVVVSPVAALPVGLVLLQPDLGTAAVLSLTAGGVLLLSGIRARVLILVTLVVSTVVTVTLSSGLLADYQLARLTTFLDPESDPQGTGYNALQARLAIGSGGLLGTGLFRGPRTSGAFIPEQHTDFVFTVAGEELGFVGAAGVILLLGIVIWRAIRVAGIADDVFGRVAAGGIACWFAAQSYENIGMTIGLAPITGVPLPFVSYGGTSLATCLIAIGVLQAIHAQATEP